MWLGMWVCKVKFDEIWWGDVGELVGFDGELDEIWWNDVREFGEIWWDFWVRIVGMMWKVRVRIGGWDVSENLLE